MERLKAANLTLYQARAYLALGRLRVAKVTPLARASRVPRNKLYRVLDDLALYGLAEQVNKEPLEYRALPLTPFLENRIKDLIALKAEFSEIESSPKAV